ncbi:stage III sporulation protein AG [Parablautia muri]|uniref:Stage III sporulation protein AG n=1 Tax=Parablautia muri TaxID=2320879 RepID=A0A9X5GS36_9FIRM|nr:stage III sporulation protein AG [Parablautia muri]NBJ91692.1 stage III sporulation protein AG [Parablautia muri]
MEEKEWTKKLKLKFTKDNFLIMLLSGILLLVVVWPTEKTTAKRMAESGQSDSESAILNLQPESIPDLAFTQSGAGSEDALLAYASFLELSLEKLLGSMEGVGKVQVMVTLESSGEAVVEKDINTTRNGTTEVDSAGGSRNTTDISNDEQTIYLKGQGSEDTPYVKKVLAPKVAGVVVSAEGGGDAQIVKNITEAIQALFGIGAHKIKIVKMIS